MTSDPATPGTIDEYMAGFPDEVKAVLEEIRSTVRAEAPDAQETIKYQIPTFTLHGNLVHYAAFAKHIGFYPIPSGIEAFRDELSAYKQGKGSVQFPLDRPIPYDLIRRIVAFRVEETEKRAEARRKKR